MTNLNSACTHLYCSKCELTYDLHQPINLCKCGMPLLVSYDYAKASLTLNKASLKSRERSMYRYREVLPVQSSENIVSLGEGGTTLHHAKRLGENFGMNQLFLKDESTNPTGSFKARGLGMAVSRAKELGLNKLIVPTAGNAGSAMSAYSAVAGMTACVIMPEDSDQAFILDCRAHGATVKLVKGSIKDCGHLVGQMVESDGYFSVATLKEPYRIEGKKTMGYEIAEHFDWELPDHIIYPTGGGTGLIGMWKAFDEMETMGLIGSHRPKMTSVQAEGCAPIVRAFEQGKENAEGWDNPQTRALGLRVPSAIGDFLILIAIRKSGGTAISVSEKEMLDSCHEIASMAGIFSAPEGGATLAALKKMRDSGTLQPDDKVVLFITGCGYKYLSFFDLKPGQKS